jgi:NAD(P)H-dependent FMN reductase
MKRAIAIDGSSRKNSRTSGLLKELGIRTYRLEDGIQRAINAILKADTVVFASPIYWFSITALMKELIERLPEAPDYPCQGKTAYFVAVYEEDGAQQAINQMMAPLNHMGFKIPPYACFFYNVHMAEKSEDQWQLKGMRYLRSRLR